MPNVYRPGEFVPELQGVTRGAVSVVCHVPQDLELVYALAETAPRPPSSPLVSLAQALRAKSLNWHEWWQHWISSGGKMHPLYDTALGFDTGGAATLAKETVELKDSNIETLKQVLSALYYMWTAHPDDAADLACCISIPLDMGPSAPLTEWEGNQPALAFGQGSLWVEVGLAAWRARGFIAGLILRGGIDAASRRAGLVNKARQVAIAKLRSAGRVQASELPDLRQMTANDIKPGNHLCVLIHGLCSTDAGTFDQFEEEIRRRCATSATKLQLAGFPHDSMTASIETNAEELAQLLVERNLRNVRLVCHSRGGLVARRTAAWLRQEQKRTPSNNDPWIHSCLTFGTPHLGTSAASAPKGLTGCLLSLAHLHRSPSVSAVADILASRKFGETWRGVSELAPIEEKSSYLPVLKRHESEFLYLDDPPLNLHVFGSVGPDQIRRQNWKVRLMERILGTAEHDLLVPIDSSVPRLRNPGHRMPLTVRSHFEYFSYIAGEPAAPAFWNLALSALGLEPPVQNQLVT
jgi:pimeloyl-ACP methyl ester carboxylesterase